MESILLNDFSQTKLSSSSQKQHAKKLSQWIEYTSEHTIDALLDNPEKSLEILSSIPTIKQTSTNRHVFISALVAYITHVIPTKTKNEERISSLTKRWKEVQKENWEPLSEHYSKNEPTENQKEKVMPFDEIVKIRESLERGSFERLLLSFYTMMEPIRADYYSTEIIHDGQESKEENYLVLGVKDARIVIRDFKTKNKHHIIENKLPEELVTDLHISLTKYPRSYLFVSDDKKTPFTRKLFSNWACRTLSRVLKQPMTLTVLRHLYISEKIKEETPIDELKEIAKKMGHTRDMQRVYDWS
jgi:hypothetical protein